jgi:DNA-directed RNA polymerase subunit RPC12/RpoP
MKRWKDWKPTFWQAHLISLRIGICGVVLMMLPSLMQWNGVIWTVLSGVGWVLFVIGLIIEYRFWRCPYCGKQLPMRGGSLEFCSACGAKLEKE